MSACAGKTLSNKIMRTQNNQIKFVIVSFVKDSIAHLVIPLSKKKENPLWNFSSNFVLNYWPQKRMKKKNTDIHMGSCCFSLSFKYLF